MQHKTPIEQLQEEVSTKNQDQEGIKRVNEGTGLHIDTPVGKKGVTHRFVTRGIEFLAIE